MPLRKAHIAEKKSVKGHKLAACNAKGPANWVATVSEEAFISAPNRCKRCEAILQKRRAKTV